MMTIARRASRAIPIIRVRATCRVPFGLMPVTAATAVMSTARTSQTIHVMTDDSIHVDPSPRTSRKKVTRPAAWRWSNQYTSVLLTNASIRLSGDHEGTLIVP